jgi:uncharacterized protein
LKLLKDSPRIVLLWATATLLLRLRQVVVEKSPQEMANDGICRQGEIMTPQETQLLNDLVRRVRETQLTEKDPEAEHLLREGLSSQPDAIYILAQTALVQNIALQQAGAQIEQLKQQLQQAQQQAQQAQRPARATSFLGSLLGHRDEEQPQAPPPPPPAAPQPQRPSYSGQPQYQQQPPQYQQQPPQYQQQYQPVAVPAPPPGYAPGYPAQTVPPAVGGGGSSFLRSAATTAAGVAAGALAFEGIQSLFHGMSHPSGFGYGGFGGFGNPAEMGGYGGAPVEETIVNNYYDSPDPNREHHEQEASYDDRPGGQEAFDRSDYDAGRDSPRAEDASYDPDQGFLDDDDQLADDTSFDDGGSDDFSGGDDSSFA